MHDKTGSKQHISTKSVVSYWDLCPKRSTSGFAPIPHWRHGARPPFVPSHFKWPFAAYNGRGVEPATSLSQPNTTFLRLLLLLLLLLLLSWLPLIWVHSIHSSSVIRLSSSSSQYRRNSRRHFRPNLSSARSARISDLNDLNSRRSSIYRNHNSNNAV